MSNQCKRISGLCDVVARPGSAPKRTNLPPAIKGVGVGTGQSVHRLCLQAGPSSGKVSFMMKSLKEILSPIFTL